MLIINFTKKIFSKKVIEKSGIDLLFAILFNV